MAFTSCSEGELSAIAQAPRDGTGQHVLAMAVARADLWEAANPDRFKLLPTRYGVDEQ